MPDAGEQVLRETLELGEYEANALDGLLRLGRTTAPNLAEATGIPNARIYGILEDLGNAGYVKIIPGRPKEFEPKEPAAILEQAAENRRQRYESFRSSVADAREDFLDTYEPLYERADDEIGASEELFYVVDIGEPSERQTREIYRGASAQLLVMTQSFEYIDSVESALRDALAADVRVRVLFSHPDRLSATNADIQREVLDRFDDSFRGVQYQFSGSPMPWRGTIADPGTDDGTAIFLVGEKDTPLHMRQAAITDDESFVAGMERYFQLVWDHESVSTVS